jgi:carbohydrate diacid regulator
MISNQILQATLDGLKAIARVDLAVTDPEGRVVVSTGDIPGIQSDAGEFAASGADSQEIKGNQYFKIYDDQALEYVLAVGGAGEDVYTLGKMAAFQVQSLSVAYRERFDKDNFFKNLLLDNLLLVDIYSRAKKLHIVGDTPRVVILTESSNTKDINILETVRSLCASNPRSFVTAVDETDVVVVLELEHPMSKPAEQEAEIEVITSGLRNALAEAGALGIKIAYGSIASEIKEVSRSYKEARMAADVGRIFFEEKEVIAYSGLGIGRLIYQLPIPLCRLFIKEIFDGRDIDDFDDEILPTIDKFFENSLNVSETSRQLFIHRNTLVYRLDKIQKSTGLDLRVFDDAITFKIALMVVKYMKYMKKNEF